MDTEVVYYEAFRDNHDSVGMSRTIGYEENGVGRHAPQGVARETLRFRMTRQRWATVSEQKGWRPVAIEGLDGCRDLFD